MLVTGPEFSDSDLVIGLVNNTRGAGLHSTEAQFIRLLQNASADTLVRLRRFSPYCSADSRYETMDALWSSQLDGIIVTGAEPHTAQLEDEPLWPVLSRITDWAAAHTGAAIFSCLAAHAATYRLSGLQRHRLPAKLSGVFMCERAASHVWTLGAPTHWPVPHSRYNDLDAAALERAGYEILSAGPGGVDSFAYRAGCSQFLLLQGHPEYSADSLLLEYRRDIRRWLQGRRPDWPLMPVNYFDTEAEQALTKLQREAAMLSPAEVMDELAAQITRLPPARWHRYGSALFAAWLGSLGERSSGCGQALALAVS